MSHFEIGEFITLERLRSRMINASLRPGNSIEDLLRTCFDQLTSLLPYQVFSIYLLNRFGQMKRLAHLSRTQPDISVPEEFDSGDWQSLLPFESLSGYYDPLILRSSAIPASDPLNAAYRNAGLRLNDLY